MKKFIVSLVMVLSFFIVPLSAYEIPDNSLYVTVDDSNLGQVTIYFPFTDLSLSMKDMNIVNVGPSNVTGYFTYNGNDYTVTFQPYQFGRYRLNNTTQNVYLDIIDIVETNLVFVEDDNFIFYRSRDYVFIASILILILVVIIK